MDDGKGQTRKLCALHLCVEKLWYAKSGNFSVDAKFECTNPITEFQMYVLRRN